MNKKKFLKKILFITLVLLVLASTIIVTHIKSIEYWQSYGRFNAGVKCVYREPDPAWYISIKNLEEEADGKLIYKPWNHGFSFDDSDNIYVDGELYTESDFIISYKDELYINMWAYESMMDIANLVAEQRNRIYNLGDIVILRSDYKIPDYAIIINAVGSDIFSHNETTHVINFTTSFGIDEDKRTQLFDHVETGKGTIIDEFTFVDEGTVQVELPVGETISIIVVRSPDYENCIRKVSIEEQKE